MNNIEPIVRDHLVSPKVMQLATVAGDQPWVCTVHFAHNDNLNLYWVSMPDSRHSQEIAKNSHTAATVVVRAERPLIAVQIEGDALLLGDVKNQGAALQLYADRHGRGHDWVEEMMGGKSPFRLYQLTPRLIAIFDQKNFPHAPKQEWKR